MVGTEPAAPMPVDAARVKGSRVLIVRSPYYQAIAQSLTRGATEVLEKHGIGYDIVDVPGALEIPQALGLAVALGRFGDAGFTGAIALGCVIRGETTHYEIVSENANHWLMDLAVGHAIPLGNAILTVETMDQAVARADGEHGGKGAEAARACLALMAYAAAFGNDEE
ncbi:MAG: 6,7-dimethyl-8-ribityllumazine synthase [Hyphomicrobium sp.]|nr:6,7-dimethyl-8-ribityllumazine synthase [Hyphomicrobium sp.]